MREAGEALLSAANEAGGRDNITVVLFRLEEVTPGGADGERGGGVDGAQATVGATTIVPPARTAPSQGAERASKARSVAPLRPRRPGDEKEHRKRRRRRRVGAFVRVVLACAAVLGVLAAAGYLATQYVYFIGTNPRGLVTVFSGLPYELPGGIKLYSTYYISGVPASTVATERRRSLLDNSLRSQTSAQDLVRSLELGQLAGQ